MGNLLEIIKDMDSVIIAFSGGIDSTLLTKLCYGQLKDKAIAVTIDIGINSTEANQTKKLASKLGIKHIFIKKDIMADSYFRNNPKERCYYCKRTMFQIITELKNQHGLSCIVDGSNVDDLKDLRPGFKALNEFNIRSPFIEANMTKNDIRFLARNIGLKTWDKPAQGCLATRIPHNYRITKKKLNQIEKGEALLNKMGFYPTRLRHKGDEASLEFSKKQRAILDNNGLKRLIDLKIKGLGFKKTVFNENTYCRE